MKYLIYLFLFLLPTYLLATDYDVMTSAEITTNTTTLVKSSKGYLSHIFVSTTTIGGYFSVVDSTASVGGTATTVVTFADCNSGGLTFWFKRSMQNGIRIVTAAGAKIVVFYK